MTINYDRLPEHMRGAFQRYIEKGISPGGFATAVLSNDLKEAFRRADDINRASMFDTVEFLVNEAPGGCWGSPRRVEEWIAAGGLASMEEAR